MEYNLVEKGYIPFDKSLIIRMGILDLKDGNDNCIKFLRKNYNDLSDDLKSLYEASLAWKAGKKQIPVGESGTLYRCLRIYAWSEGLDKEFILEGTLEKRREEGMICDNPDIINWSPLELLTLDHGTSQWASASYLLGLTDKIDNPPFKLQVTYDAVGHWKEKQANGELWEDRYDETILAQATAYLDMLHRDEIDFKPQQAEDYCFARGFGLITPKEGESRWPSLRGHETSRIIEMELVIKSVELGEQVNSKDHRAVQWACMAQKLKGQIPNVKYPSSVNKSWPQFWKFLADSPHLLA